MRQDCAKCAGGGGGEGLRKWESEEVSRGLVGDHDSPRVPAGVLKHEESFSEQEKMDDDRCK